MPKPEKDGAKMNEYFSTRFKYDKSRDTIWAEICRHMQRYVQHDAAVIDLGAGYCDFINNIRAKEKHATDVNEGAGAYAREGVIFHVASCTHMPDVKSSYFDVAFCSNLFEHLTDEEFGKTLQEIKRILRPQGTLIVLQPNFRFSAREYFDDYTHKKIFTDVSLKDYLESAGFEVIKSVPGFLPMSFKSKAPKSALLARLYLLSPIKPFAKQMLLVARKSRD